jgi:hypothetical protein
MKRVLSLCLSALAIVPATAFAAPIGIATIGGGAALPAQIVIDGKVWRCTDGKCQGPTDQRRVAAERTCKDLARKVGTVETFTIGEMTLDSEQLAACNKGARAS